MRKTASGGWTPLRNTSAFGMMPEACLKTSRTMTGPHMELMSCVMPQWPSHRCRNEFRTGNRHRLHLRVIITVVGSLFRRFYSFSFLKKIEESHCAGVSNVQLFLQIRRLGLFWLIDKHACGLVQFINLFLLVIWIILLVHPY